MNEEVTSPLLACSFVDWAESSATVDQDGNQYNRCTHPTREKENKKSK